MANEQNEYYTSAITKKRVILPPEKNHIMKLKITVQPYIKYIFTILSIALCIQFLIRALFFILNYELVAGAGFNAIFEAFMVGLRYDAVVSAYLITIPTLLLTFCHLFDVNLQKLYSVTGVIFTIAYGVAFIVFSADIPFFHYYNAHINISALNWIETPSLMFKEMFTNIYYLPYIFLGCVVLFLWYRIVRYFTARSRLKEVLFNIKTNWFQKSLTLLITLVVLFFGIRGQLRFDFMPIGIKNAYFCDNSFLNQLGLNPVFTFVESMNQQEIELIDLNAAYTEVSKSLNVGSDKEHDITRNVVFNADSTRKMNVVVILMESMSADKMGVYGNKDQLTPFLDSLTKQSLFYPNTYSAGEHTFNGIFSTLYSFPAQLDKNPMINVLTANQKFSGLPVTLKKKGYSTLFMCTNNKDFDNLGSFLTSNGIQQIVSEEDYPKDKIVSGWGIADDYLYDVSIEKMNQLSKKETPFFTTILSISTHSPYAIPNGLPVKFSAQKKEDKIYQYADWSLRKFFDMAKKQSWFDNTIFVLVADHGQVFDRTYELPLSYHHIPLMIYSPKLISPKTDPRFALQMDVFPTIMGILKQSYTNNTMGVDLQNDHPRPCAYFSSDKMIGILDNNHYYIWNRNAAEALYLYNQKSTTNILSKFPTLVQKLKAHGFSMIQVTNDIFKNRKTS